MLRIMSWTKTADCRETIGKNRAISLNVAPASRSGLHRSFIMLPVEVSGLSVILGQVSNLLIDLTVWQRPCAMCDKTHFLMSN